MPAKFRLAEEDGFFDQVVHGHFAETRFSFLDEPLDPANDLRRPVGLFADLLQGDENLLVPFRQFFQPADASVGVVLHGMQRLVQLVRQAGSHLAHHAQSRHVRQFRLMPLQLLIVGLLEDLLGLLQVFDVGGTSNPTSHLTVFTQHWDRPH